MSDLQVNLTTESNSNTRTYRLVANASLNMKNCAVFSRLSPLFLLQNAELSPRDPNVHRYERCKMTLQRRNGNLSDATTGAATAPLNDRLKVVATSVASPAGTVAAVTRPSPGPSVGDASAPDKTASSSSAAGRRRTGDAKSATAPSAGRDKSRNINQKGRRRVR